MKYTFFKLITVMILVSSFINAPQKTTLDQEQILNLYLKKYQENSFYRDNGDILIIDKSQKKLRKEFLANIVDKMNQYKRLKKLCTDNPKNENCGLMPTYAMFDNFLNDAELDYFKEYQMKSNTEDYSIFFKNNSKVKVVDSASFYSRAFNDNGVFFNRLSFKGPFFSKDTTKALLEVYDCKETAACYFMVFKKVKKQWVMLGNVKF